MPIYKLSEQGRKITWVAWKKMGGCGLSQESRMTALQRIKKNVFNDTTLGEIEDAWATAGRELARFAIDHLKKGEFAMPYEQGRG